MDYQALFIISLIVLVGLIVYIVGLRKDRDKYLFSFKPIKTERDKLREELENTNKKLSVLSGESSTALAAVSRKQEEKSDKKSDKKSQKKSDKAEVRVENADLALKIKELKADNAKLKEDNFRLKNDNKALRTDLRSNSASNEEDQRLLVELRETRDEAKLEAELLKAKYAELAKQLRELRDAPQVNVENKSEQEQETKQKQLESLERENARLTANLRETRGDLSDLKRDFQAQLSEAKKEFADAQRSMRKEEQVLVRQMQQSKKRADNNHKVFLIARAQLLLAEKRLRQYDETYASVFNLATNNSAIDEIVKKFITMDARESIASRDVLLKDQQIEALKAENDTLKKQLRDAELAFADPSEEAPQSIKRDDSLSDLMKGLNSGDGSSELAGLDLLDESGWEEL